MKETIAIVPITLINTQLIHQFVFCHADAVNPVLLRAGITLSGIVLQTEILLFVSTKITEVVNYFSQTGPLF